MRRRTFAALLGATLAAPRLVWAQGANRVYRIALFDEASKTARPHDWAAFQTRLRALGLVEGKSVLYEHRFGRAQTELLPGLAAELVATKPDIIVCAGTPTTRAAMRATSRIPIIFTAAGDPVGTGLVTSLSRPGGNVTGFAVSAPETTQKLLELMRELLPGLQRIGYMNDTSNPGTFVSFTRLEETASKIKLTVQMLDGVGQASLERSFATIKKDRIQGLILGNSGAVIDYRDQILQFAAREKLPVGSGRREYVEAGGLVFYGIDRRPLFQAAADLTLRILKGAKPAEIPVEQVAIIRTMVNLKTAHALGVRIPESIKARVDEVIE